MRIRILGSAAGGGLPQWNCRCPNCQAARAGSPDVQPRSQSSVAISADGDRWFLLNVSADVRQQILAFADLGPRASPPAPMRAQDSEAVQRGTCIAGCVLTDAEIDHTSGLLQLREGCSLGIISTPLVHRWLSQYLPIETVLRCFAQRPWIDLPLNAPLELPLPDGAPSGLEVRAFEAGRDVPRFVPEDPAEAVGSVVGLQIQDTKTGGKLLFAPAVAAIDRRLAEAAEGSDCILIDGTFWSDDEPIRSEITNRTARQMGHVPVDGADGSLNWLNARPVRHRVYIHINNTNPMLDRRSREHQLVKEKGVKVGADGDTFHL